jgi:hypothetical protein
MSRSSSTSSGYSGYSGYLHLGSEIVASLKRYGAIAVPRLAGILGRSPEELEEYLQPLQDRGVIVRNANNEVGLSDEKLTPDAT